MSAISDSYNFIISHKAAISLALGWLIHMGFPMVQKYCQSRESGFIPNLFFKAFGKPNTISQNDSVDKPKTNT